ncbi:MAG: hypothetical protein IT380_29595 [Myxococcales bacterium]|nr:hypothetical protein [Myxococcales bacterium]
MKRFIVSSRTERVVFVAALLVALSLVAWNVAHIGNFIEDDTLISLRYSQRLLEGKGLTWTDGERVEGYSNLSWVLLSAGLGAFGVDLIAAARALAALFTAVAFVALLAFVRRVGQPKAEAPHALARHSGVALAALLLGATSPFAVWICGALEQPLVLACLAVTLWALATLEEREFTPRAWAWIAGTALALMVLTRPDAPLLVLLVIATFPIVFGRGRWRQQLVVAAIVAGLPLAVWLSQLGFRLAYYGEWVPNTAYIKASVSAARAREGLNYVLAGLQGTWLLTASATLGLVAAMFEQRTRRWALALCLLGFGWLSYVIAIGGDHFPAWRHLLLFDLLAAAVAGLGLAALAQRWARQWLASPLLLLAIGVTVPKYVHYQWGLDPIAVAARVRWQWEGQAVGLTLREAFSREQPLHAVSAAGCLPYFSGLPSLDILGLNDKHIARQPPWPHLPLSHDHGDGKYVLERKPDLVTFGLPRGDRPIFKSGDEMAADPSWPRDYVRVRFQTLEPLSLFSESFVRIKGRLGIRPNDRGGLVVPTYLFSGATAVPLPDEAMGALLKEASVATLTLDSLPAGTWRARLEPASPRVLVRLADPTIDGQEAEKVRPGDLALASPRPVRIELETSDFSTVVGALLIERVGEGGAGPSARELNTPNQLPSAPSLALEPGFGVWSVAGDAFGDSASSTPRHGQRAIENSPGPLLNSFADSCLQGAGDECTGVARSTSFVPGPKSWLEFWVGGGRAEGADTQVGVRLEETLASGVHKVRYVASGERDENMRRIRLDLSWLRGRTLSIVVFDQSQGAWGHVVAGGFSLSDEFSP